MQQIPPERSASDDGARLPVDRRTLVCVGLGGALAAVLTSKLSSAPAWRALDFDVRIAGLAVLSLIAGALFALRDVLGDCWFGFLVFGLLAGFGSVGVYGLVSLLAMPPSAGVRFLVAAPAVAALGIAAGRAIVRRLR